MGGSRRWIGFGASPTGTRFGSPGPARRTVGRTVSRVGLGGVRWLVVSVRVGVGVSGPVRSASIELGKIEKKKRGINRTRMSRRAGTGWIWTVGFRSGGRRVDGGLVCGEVNAFAMSRFRFPFRF